MIDREIEAKNTNKIERSLNLNQCEINVKLRKLILPLKLQL